MRKVAVLMVCLAFALVGVGCSCASQDNPAPDPTPAKITVPNLLSLECADAEKQLANAGLVTGKIGYDYSDTIPNGHVTAQNPQALTEAEPGAVVDITVSKGKQEPADVTVPNLIGMDQTDAENALQDAKLVAVQAQPVVNTSVDPGKVCEQSVPAGNTVKEGTQITFATALAPETIAVPDEVGKAKDDAIADLQNAGLGYDTSTAYSNNVDADKVISQSVGAGTQVAKGTVVTLQISLGPQPPQTVAVPDIMTYTRDDAIAALQSAGLDYRYTGDDDGTVVHVDPDVGTEVDVGSTVTFSLQHESTLVEIPDVAGMSGTDAAAALDAVGLDLDYDTDNPDKELQGTSPEAGTQVDVSSVVDAVYPPEPTPPTPDPAGAWSGNGTAAKSTLTDDEKQIFDATLEDAGKKGVSPVATLATQVVSGTNYAFLAQESSTWYVVETFAGLDGTVSFNSANVIDPGQANTTDSWPGGDGGWTVGENCAGKLPKDAKKAFEAAMADYSGPSVKPVALLATQEVSGTNFEILCVGEGSLYVAVIYEDASGSSSVSSMGVFDIASYLG